MAIKLIKQKDKCGCAVACVAMVTGKSYKDIAFDFNQGFSEQGLVLDQTIEYLGNAGFSIIHKEIKHWMNISFGRSELLKPFAPVHVIRTVDKFDSESGHLAVMTKKGKILCPSGVSDKVIRRDSYAITDCIGLYR